MTKTTNVMIVEDNIHAHRALKGLLSQQAGIKVTADASNGLEAIDMIGRRQPDLVLMDMCMPVMDGLEATRIIKKNWPHVKVVVLTIYADSKQDATRAGADAFLVKGCPLGELISTVTDLRTVRRGDKLVSKG